MLDVERGVDGDPRVEQLEHVLPALGVAGTGGVGVRQLVDQDHRGAASERGVQVELPEGGASVGHVARGQDVEALEERFRLGPPVRLDVADEHVGPVGAELARLLEHREGLADAGGGAEEQLEAALRLARLLLSGAGEQRLGIGTVVGKASPAIRHVSQRRSAVASERKMVTPSTS